MKHFFILSSLLLCLIACDQKLTKDPLAIYANEKEPVKLFPGEISIDGIQWNNAFANNNHEIFYCRQLPTRAQLVTQKYDGKGFTDPVAIPFDTLYNYSDPYISPKGDHLIFMSNIPHQFEKDNFTTGFQLYQSYKENGAWSKPKIVFHTETGVGYPSRTKDGTLFFSLQPKDGSRKSNIFYSKFINGKYEEPEKLPKEINSLDKFEGDAYIAPKRDYIIFAGFDREDNIGFSDLYISFHLGDNKWTQSKSLGAKINSIGYDGSPYVTEDGKYLIFTSSRNSPNNNSFFNHYIIPFDIEEFK